jgi:hypothetical protein
MSGYKIIGLSKQPDNKSVYKIQGKTSDITKENEEDEGEYLDSLPDQKGFWSKLPRNILIGLTHAGRNLHNLPHDLVKSAENSVVSFGNQLNKSLPLPKDFQEKLDSRPKHRQFKLSEHLPNDTESYADVFGQQGDGTLTDNVIQKGFEYSPEILGGAAALRAGLRKFPVTQRGSSRQLRDAEKLINNRGINNFQMNLPLLQETVPFLPKTHATGEMFKGIMNGEYGPAFALQSQVGKHARDLAKSPLASERLIAPKARELKQMILHEMEQALRGTGHHKEADLLRGGIEDYAKYMKFKEKAWPILKKLGIPTSGLAVLGIGTRKGRGIGTKILENIVD